MTADIRLAVSVIQTVFAQNHRAAATAADDHANTPNNKKKPLPQPELNCAPEVGRGLLMVPD
ncbi:hypothetical protein [Bifidobacterium catenulatum]|uniref:hypothetical protein n=1 Tax=Bifidobacterium catenulatum TaxID=1686 RepID=UPI0012AF6B5B|nr:hypothetical protein [Bifidobacterium catenulatum]